LRARLSFSLLIVSQVLLPLSIPIGDTAELNFSCSSALLEEQEFLPVIDLERFIKSKWKHASHFGPHHSAEVASLVSKFIQDRSSNLPCDAASPLGPLGFNLPLSLSLATCAAMTATSINAPGIFQAAKQLLLQAQLSLGTCSDDSIFRMFDDDAAIQISSLGRQLLMLPVFGLSAADCTATALQLALHFENFPLFCHVASHIKKAHAADATSIVKAICDSGACQLSEVASPICCNFTDLSPGPSFSLPFIGDALFDCVVSLLSGTMHCVINVVRGGHHVIIDYVLPDAALPSLECLAGTSDAAPHLPSASIASPPPLKGILRASGIDAILERGNSPFARTGFSDQVVAMITEGATAEQLSSYLTDFLGDENLVVALVQWVQTSLPKPVAPAPALPVWNRKTKTGCFGTEMTAAFDGPPTVMHYSGAILILDSSCVVFLMVFRFVAYLHLPG